jgi:hypothetical protein
MFGDSSVDTLRAPGAVERLPFRNDAICFPFEDTPHLRTVLMTDISDGGARLIFSPDIRIPERFMLRLGDVEKWQCEVVWRRGGEAGVRFAGTGVFVAAG